MQARRGSTIRPIQGQRSSLLSGRHSRQGCGAVAPANPGKWHTATRPQDLDHLAVVPSKA